MRLLPSLLSRTSYQMFCCSNSLCLFSSAAQLDGDSIADQDTSGTMTTFKTDCV